MRVKPRNVSSSTRDDVNVMIEIAAPLALRLCKLIARPGWDNLSQPRNASTPRTCAAARATAAAKGHKIAGHVRGCGKSAGDGDIYLHLGTRKGGRARYCACPERASRPCFCRLWSLYPRPSQT